MGYKIKPYLWGGFGRSPFGKVSEYEISNGELIIHWGYGKAPTHIELDGSTIQPNQSFWQGVSNIGSVTIKRSGFSQVCPNIPNVKDFINLIEREKRRNSEVRQLETALQGRAVMFPTLPDTYDTVFRYGFDLRNNVAHRRNVALGEFVRSGDPIFTLVSKRGGRSMASIVAPFDGKVLAIQSGSGFVGGIWKSTKDGGVFDYWQNCNFVLQPAMNFDPQNVVGLTYSEVTDLIKYQAKLKRFDDIRDAIFREIGMLEGSEARIVDMDSFWNQQLLDETKLIIDCVSAPDYARAKLCSQQEDAAPFHVRNTAQHELEYVTYDNRDGLDSTVWTTRHDDALRLLNLVLPFTEAELSKEGGERLRSAQTQEEVQKVKHALRVLSSFAV